MRGIILVILCVCVLGILELIAGVFFGGQSGILKKTHPEEKATLQTVNKDSLVELIQNTEQINRSAYTAESVAVLDQNIADAQNAMNGSCTQAELDTYYMSIVKAIQNLKTSDEATAAETQSSAGQQGNAGENTAVGLQ